MVATPYGRSASRALARSLAVAKGDNALAPVTVIVPSNFAGLAARRVLATGSLDQQPDPSNNSLPLAGGTDVAGIVNVHFLTPFRLAELLAAGRLGDKRPLTNPVLGAAVRRALRDDPRHFAAVREHRATEQALATVTGELSNVGAAGLAAIEAAGGHAASVVAMYRSIASHLTDHHHEADVARAAARRTDLPDALVEWGHLIWYLPGPLSAPLAGLLRAVFAIAPATVIAGRSGQARADEQMLRSCRIAGIESAAIPELEHDPPLAGNIISVTDADEEVRAVVREVMQLAESGFSLDRIGIFYPAPDPYVRIIEQQLRAASLPANGPSRVALDESVAGRALCAALELPSDRWRRDRVMALISTAPLRHGDRPVRPASWEALSRNAGVVGGLADWQTKLERHRNALSHDRDEAVVLAREGWLQRLDRELADLDELSAFVAALADAVQQVDDSATWVDRSQATLALLHALVGRGHTHSNWPELEQQAFDRVEVAIERVALLDDIDPNPSLAVYQRALRAELEVARGRTGRFGDGVVYGPLSSAIGQDLDAVFILGCTEGLSPAARREDALLPDAARRLTRGDLVEHLGDLGEQHRLFLAALASAPADRRWLLLSRGDLRSNRQTRPSRWLLPSASVLAGRTLYATDFAHASPPGVHEVASHAAALVDASHYGSVGERDVATVYRHVLGGGDATEHPAVAPVARGLVAQSARHGDEFTEFDGNLAGHPVGQTVDQLLSPSRLESWAACGFRYFLAFVLGLRDRENPERTIELSAMDRGLVLHRILERFVTEMIEAGPPDASASWTPTQRQRAREIAEEVFDEWQSRGRTGRPVVWATIRKDLLELVDAFLTVDDRHRSATRSVPARVELPFGMEDAPPLELDVGGRTLRFRGIADRVDRADGAHFIVSDYKTGKGAGYKTLVDGDPVDAGRSLQLGLYAEAARQLLDAKSVEAHYWMVNPAAGFARYGYPYTADRSERLHGVLDTIATGIEEGVFNAVPGQWESFRGSYEQCRFCDFDRLCESGRSDQAAAKSQAVELGVRSGLVYERDAQ